MAVHQSIHTHDPSGAIRAIETHYAGHRFRSRLEARWAVAFDRMGIAWEYEPQGFHVTHRLTHEEGTFPYLPDFYLPDLNVWAEVKGHLDDDEAIRLLNAAASLSSNDEGGCQDAGGTDLVVLGRLGRARLSPTLLHMHKGDLQATCLFCGRHTGGTVLADDVPTIYPRAAERMLNGIACLAHAATWAHAYAAARQARFEHGERG